MRKLFFVAAIACMTLLVSCEKGVQHTGDDTGTLYGVWILNAKTEVVQNPNEEPKQTQTDYSSVHFYLALSEFPIPYALGKKGSFTALDLKDVDVDGVTFTYNQDQKKISFNKLIWLTDDLLTYSMRLMGTFDVLELTDKSLVLRQEEPLIHKTTTYTFKRYK